MLDVLVQSRMDSKVVKSIGSLLKFETTPSNKFDENDPLKFNKRKYANLLEDLLSLLRQIFMFGQPYILRDQ